MELRGSRALVTGATGGIGHAIARALAARGAQLVVTGRRTDVLEPLAQEIGGRAVASDLADRDAVDRLLDEAGDIDVLVANAALPGSGPLLEYEPEQIDRALDVNLRAPIMLSRALVPRLLERGAGHLVFVSSLSGKAISPGASIYCATKFGMRGFALALREDLIATGVGVSVVYPGFISDAGHVRRVRHRAAALRRHAHDRAGRRRRPVRDRQGPRRGQRRAAQRPGRRRRRRSDAVADGRAAAPAGRPEDRRLDGRGPALQAMRDKVNLAEKFALLDAPYEPGIVGYLNDYKLQIVKVDGAFVWHRHEDTDDFFLVISGRLTIHLRDRDVVLEPGELFVVPRGVEHCPEAEEETQVLLIEPKGTPNTGDAGGAMTAEPREL